jgi:hypothetical protein
MVGDVLQIATANNSRTNQERIIQIIEISLYDKFYSKKGFNGLDEHYFITDCVLDENLPQNKIYT